MPPRVGDTVRVIDGPFEDFTGTVVKIDDTRRKLTINVNLYGRLTPIELDFLQVQRL